MVLVKVWSEVLGTSEFALRLIPFINGLISLVLFYFLAKRFIGKNAIPLAG